MEVYSPNGKCNYRLAPLPSAKRRNPVLVYANNQIIACSGGVACWEYHPLGDIWTTISTAPFTHNYQPGVVYQDKVLPISIAYFKISPVLVLALVFIKLLDHIFSWHMSSIFQTHLYLILHRYQWKKIAKTPT